MLTLFRSKSTPGMMQSLRFLPQPDHQTSVTWTQREIRLFDDTVSYNQSLGSRPVMAGTWPSSCQVRVCQS